jgi:hypothetical protein
MPRLIRITIRIFGRVTVGGPAIFEAALTTAVNWVNQSRGVFHGFCYVAGCADCAGRILASMLDGGLSK